MANVKTKPAGGVKGMLKHQRMVKCSKVRTRLIQVETKLQNYQHKDHIK
jgi:hypothetical protein